MPLAVAFLTFTTRSISRLLGADVSTEAFETRYFFLFVADDDFEIE